MGASYSLLVTGGVCQLILCYITVVRNLYNNKNLGIYLLLLQILPIDDKIFKNIACNDLQHLNGIENIRLSKVAHR